MHFCGVCQSVPFLAAPERAPIAAPVPQVTQRRTLFERASALADGPQMSQERSALVHKSPEPIGRDQEEEEPWVTISPAPQRQASPRMDSAFEMDKYIDEEFELTNYDKHRYRALVCHPSAEHAYWACYVAA